MIPNEIQSEIREELSRIEASQDCSILFAVESGSRAWGFESTDSDYDVRFIYVRRSEWYLSVDLDLRRDVIERPISDLLDISGWDIRKALRLFAKSNPPLLEWLSSPIVYLSRHEFSNALRALLVDYFSPVTSTYHYLHMAQGNYRDYLKGDTVWLKKYLYALRPVLAVRWIEQERGVVPMEFERLMLTLEGEKELLNDIKQLVAAKMSAKELARGPAIPTISNFLRDEIARLTRFNPIETSTKVGFAPLNRLFQQMLAAAWATY